jgi:periplasmic protein TonB
MAAMRKPSVLWTALIVTAIATGLAEARAQDQSNQTAAPKDEAPQELPKRVRVSGGVSSGLILKKVNPVYPKKARKKHIQGTVILHAIISKEGDLEDLTLISGDPLLAQAALDAAKQWKYRPYLLQGHPVEVDTQIQMNFTLTVK